MTVTLTGPVLFPGDSEPWVGAEIGVRLVAGSASTLAHVNGTARAGKWKARTDSEGNFTVVVPALPTDDPDDVNPAQAYYEVTIGGNGRFPKYLRKIKPTTDDTTYVITDPAIAGETEDLLPPEFVQVVPEIDDAAVVAYFAANPIDVTAEVAAALAADPPLLVANDLSEVDDATARLNIGAASDSEMNALILALTARIETLEAFINTRIFVTTEGVSSAVLTFPGGVPTFETT